MDKIVAWAATGPSDVRERWEARRSSESIPGSPRSVSSLARVAECGRTRWPISRTHSICTISAHRTSAR